MSSPTPRTEFDVAAAQLDAMERFHAARLAAEAAAAAVDRSRELRMDATRRLEVLHRQQQALVSRAHEQLERSGGPLFVTAPVRAVIAHRNPWFVERVSSVLADAGVVVVATTSNGAEAIGFAVAEQPDVVLVEETLEMQTGAEVLQDVRSFAPGSLVAVQVEHSGRVGVFLDAGADTVMTRLMPPAEVGLEVRRLLGLGARLVPEQKAAAPRRTSPADGVGGTR